MKAGCCGNCRQGRRPCTMPGTCGRQILVPEGTPWWRDPAVVGRIAAGLWVTAAALAGLSLALRAWS